MMIGLDFSETERCCVLHESAKFDYFVVVQLLLFMHWDWDPLLKKKIYFGLKIVKCVFDNQRIVHCFIRIIDCIFLL
jgi:hypothetical protein